MGKKKHNTSQNNPPVPSGINKIKPKWQHILIIVILGFLVYSNSLNNPFLYDDLSNILNNNFIKDNNNLQKLFTTEYFSLAHEKTYRPVVTLSYFINYSLCKMNVVGWRIVNIMLHIVNAIMIYLLVSLILNNKNIAFFTALLFCIHPVHAEIINIISFREDLISLFFFLFSFLLYLKYIQASSSKKVILYTFSLCSFLLAVYSKEMALILPVVLVLYNYCFESNEKTINFIGRTIKTLHYWGYFGIIIFFFVQRIFLFKPDGSVGGLAVSSTSGYMGGSIFTSMMTMTKSVIYYMKILLFPFKLSVDYVFPIVLSIDVEFIISAVILISIIIIAFRMSKFSKEISFSILYFYICLIPILNIIPGATIVAERYMYFSSIGFSLLLVIIILKISRTKINGFKISKGIVILIIILCFYAIRTYIRNSDYKDSLTLWSKTLQATPNSTTAFMSRGHAYYKKGLYDKAIADYNNAILLKPKYAELYKKRGFSLKEKGLNDEAIGDFSRAIELEPERSELYDYRGVIYGTKKLYDKALADFTSSIELDSENIEAYINRGNCYWYMSLYENAIIDFTKVIKLNPYNITAYINRGHIYKAIGKPDLAQKDEETSRHLKQNQSR